jgi:anti-anti-sigma factor
MTHRSGDGSFGDFDKAWYRVESRAGCALVTAGGEIDADTASGLHRSVLAAATVSPRLVVDLTRVVFVDSTGLGVLIGARNRARDSGGSVSLVGPPAMVRNILGATRLQAAFAIHDRLEDALAPLAAP